METVNKNAGSFKRFVASAIDILIANIIRMVTFTVLANLWLKKHINNFYGEFQEKFDSNFVGNDPEKIQFIAQHSITKFVLLFFLIVFVSGALYYAYCNSSKWRATFGKKIMKIIVVRDDGEKLGFFISASHYLLSFVPWIFVFYIFSYSMLHKVNIYSAIWDNYFNLVFGLITLAWMQVHIIIKKKKTAADLICGVKVIELEE
ncbi:MAG: putative RDD family membrane protein YckC [Rickettsiales bacterium]|jgi:uncharacterized RDD family membrane protein YckC